VEVDSQTSRNLTAGSGRVNCCPQWWPARPGTILFGSWPPGDDIGPSTGFLSTIRDDGNDYTILDGETPSNGLPAAGPDGLIAYDRGGAAWLYREETGPEPIDLAAFGLANIVRIGGPSWSPDGRQLAWTAVIQDDSWLIALVLLSLDTQEARVLHPYPNAGRGGWFPPPAWSPDGRWLAFVAEDVDPERRGVWVVATDGSDEQFLGPGLNPVWSPDNRLLAYTGLERTSSRSEPVPWLVDRGAWYQIRWDLPAGARVVGWTGTP
jgi:dipeptidyl aminopeptidase/acylaminoacyl peptidase